MYLWLILQRLQPPCSTENIETGQVYSGRGNCDCSRRSHMIWGVRERRGTLACRSLMMVSLYRCLVNCFRWTSKVIQVWNNMMTGFFWWTVPLRVLWNIGACLKSMLLPQCDVFSSEAGCSTRKKNGTWGCWMELNQNRAS